MRTQCTIDYNVRVGNYTQFMGVACACRHQDGNFIVEVVVQRNPPNGEMRVFYFKCPSELRVAMELIPLAEHGKYSITGKRKIGGHATPIECCKTAEEEYRWLDEVNLFLYGLPVEYDEYWHVQ